jgi:hypothetical protein
MLPINHKTAKKLFTEAYKTGLMEVKSIRERKCLLEFLFDGSIKKKMGTKILLCRHVLASVFTI